MNCTGIEKSYPLDPACLLYPFFQFGRALGVGMGTKFKEINWLNILLDINPIKNRPTNLLAIPQYFIIRAATPIMAVITARAGVTYRIE